MKDCSVVTATYELGDGMKGTIGIIGPKRMDYEHVLKSISAFPSAVSDASALSASSVRTSSSADSGVLFSFTPAVS